MSALDHLRPQAQIREIRTAREFDLKYPQYSRPDPGRGPRPDDGAHLATAYAHHWSDEIHFHAARGMSRASLMRIYGRDAVLAVLGGAP